ncbi:MAG: exodeoxyribonuclease VII large subunit [Odoribacteraceae bacterium]|jgi:exodeoxyribonuclease VII large subunit|nr:exodeoxyribonuclease VII large subunit [Odoribacteraceae bacterium]
MKETIGLHQLNTLIKRTLAANLPSSMWVIAEIAGIGENRSGHCYLELAEKRDDTLLASSRAVIWASTYRVLKPAFREATGMTLQEGMKVLLEIAVTFHELYGLSLNIRNIDPSFTMGDLERVRRETLLRLQRDGIINMNRELPFPLLPKSIAIISSPTAAGYQDFIHQLRANTAGYAFHTCLFPATMQGTGSARSIIEALDRINNTLALFDVVVIIRGGGAQADLNSFDDYPLAANVAQFPLPVITGIGHERDESIVDRVAHANLKTPTAAAEYLLDAFRDADAALKERVDRLRAAIPALLAGQKRDQTTRARAIKQLAGALLDKQTARLRLASRDIGHATLLALHRRREYFKRLDARARGRLALLLARAAARLDELSERARARVRQTLVARRHALELQETKITLVDPRRVLERGFSITRLNGKALRDTANLAPGDILETRLHGGALTSQIKEITND